MESSKIKEVEFILENCESVIVPLNCLESGLTMSASKEDDTLLTQFQCNIQDNGEVRYGCTWDDKTHPLHRLAQYNDICRIKFTYEDGNKKELSIQWYEDEENPWDMSNENLNQTTEFIDYKTFKINIKPYIKKYSINEILGFPSGTVFKGDNGKEYEILENENIKYIDVKLEQKYLEMKYKKVS